MRNRKINTKYIEGFVDELSKKGFVDKIIKRHYGNVDFYLNDFLLREDALTMENGCKDEYLSDFFEYFFICECMWSTPDTIRVNKEYWTDCCSEYNDGISEW